MRNFSLCYYKFLIFLSFQRIFEAYRRSFPTQTMHHLLAAKLDNADLSKGERRRDSYTYVIPYIVLVIGILIIIG